MYFTDLHCHLGGCTPPEVLKSIAYDRGLKISPKDYKEFEKFIRFNEKPSVLELSQSDNQNLVDKKIRESQFKNYLSRYTLIQKIASSPIAIYQSVFETVRNAYLEGQVDLLEIKLNPMLRNEEGIYDLDSIISAACDGLQKAKTIFNKVRCGIIIESDRTFSGKQSLVLAQKALKFQDRGIVGLDISGYKKKFNLMEHFEALKTAKEGGLGISLHTNELQLEEDFFNPAIIRLVDRIGHGVQICTNPKKLKYVMKYNPQIVFEICPNSNINSGLESEESLHKIIEQLRDNNTLYTICSDGFIFNGHVKENYETLGFTNKEIEATIAVSRDASFCKK
ncbi:amidohydrolase family protein [[Mycoplasma] testudinis]|uniref:hypothetical protein n=1 Tax=[Mycoplasma] testudinis TaxID=33924 RepID=UPI000564E3B5|nr:hypothetical protein [[Mycoplasma] testudinis]